MSHIFLFHRVIRRYLAHWHLTDWNSPLSLAFGAQMTAIDISYNTFSHCWENTVQYTKPHRMTLLPFALEGSANRALVVGCFMATGHATCFKQTSCISTKKKKKMNQQLSYRKVCLPASDIFAHRGSPGCFWIQLGGGARRCSAWWRWPCALVCSDAPHTQRWPGERDWDLLWAWPHAGSGRTPKHVRDFWQRPQARPVPNSFELCN